MYYREVTYTQLSVARNKTLTDFQWKLSKNYWGSEPRILIMQKMSFLTEYTE